MHFCLLQELDVIVAAFGLTVEKSGKKRNDAQLLLVALGLETRGVEKFEDLGRSGVLGKFVESPRDNVTGCAATIVVGRIALAARTLREVFDGWVAANAILLSC